VGKVPEAWQTAAHSAVREWIDGPSLWGRHIVMVAGQVVSKVDAATGTANARGW